MAPPRSVVVLGASGSVGTTLVDALLRAGDFSPVVTLRRRPPAAPGAETAAAGAGLRPYLVPVMNPETLYRATRAALASLAGKVAALSVLGVGAGTAKLTLEGHREIDVGLNEAFARGCRDAGNVVHLGLMSAVGADAAASSSGFGAPGFARYARVKGEAEAAVLQAGPPVVSIFRPSMIVGSRHTPWLLGYVAPAFAWLIPDAYRAITAEQIARAMLATSRRVPPKSRVYHRRQMLTLGAEEIAP